MTTDPNTINSASAGQSPSRLSNAQARELSLDDSDQQLQEFIAALDMAQPVPAELAARLVEHVVKGATSANVDLLEAQMRIDGWESVLSPGEQLSTLAMRANAYLESPDGVEMFNLFTRNVARTTGEIFD
jgi:hypothetical protein